MTPDRPVTFLDRVGIGFLRDAGIGYGMRVLEVGCGDGTFTALAARIVGPTGRIVAIDSDETALQRTKTHLDLLGLTADLLHHDVETAAEAEKGPFDAVIGRFSLAYLKTPGRTLAKLRELVGDDGIIAFVEPLLSTCCTVPGSQPIDAAMQFIRDGLRLKGIDPDSGASVATLYRDAGLEPVLRIDSPIEDGTNGSCLRWIVATYQALAHSGAPAMPFQTGDAKDRITRSLDGVASVMIGPSVVSVHARTGIRRGAPKDAPEG